MNKKVELLPHNEMLYAKIREQLDKGEHSIFYSEATGLGKSFIFMRLVQDYFAGKKILYIVPKIAIWENLIHYEEFSRIGAEVEMKTFTAFNTYDSKERLFDEYDAVFVDECHHMLSDIQGMNVAIFLEDMYNNGKYAFGMTATPKYDDTFVDEIYFNVSCYGYDIFEATKFGIFPKIDLAVADIDVSTIPRDLRAKFSVIGTKSILEQILDERKDITHWLAYFGRKQDLEESESEIKRLFPDFKILKLYLGVGESDTIIKQFEEYNGKVILMSVSMLLEGVHLNNVGGVLLYRNVCKYGTYFQIYGRLCRIGLRKSPLLLDITNSVYGVQDFGIFKSGRCKDVVSEYKARDLFDVTSETFKYVELSNEMNPFKVKEYRGIKWTSLSSLDTCLGHRSGCASAYINYASGRTVEDYIDSSLGECTYEEYVNNGYKSFSKVTICGVEYKFDSISDLEIKVGRPFGSGGTVKLDTYVKIVEWERSHGFRPHTIYRGIDISSLMSVSDSLNINLLSIQCFINIEGVDVFECIDLCLDEDKKYKDIILVNGVKEICARLGISRKTVYTYYHNCKSMRDTIDHYVTDDTVYEYRGIKLSSSCSRASVARQLGINNKTFGVMMRQNDFTLEQCIDYYLDSGKVIASDNTKETLVYTGNRKYTDDENETIKTMRDDGFKWEEVANKLNSMPCNIERGLKRDAAMVRRQYCQILKNGINKDSSTHRRKYLDEELELITRLRDSGETYKNIADAVNKLECNINRNIVRSEGNVKDTYLRKNIRYKHQ